MTINVAVTVSSGPDDKICKVAVVNRDEEGNINTQVPIPDNKGSFSHPTINPGESKSFILTDNQELRVYEVDAPEEIKAGLSE